MAAPVFAFSEKVSIPIRLKYTFPSTLTSLATTSACSWGKNNNNVMMNDKLLVMMIDSYIS
jgi:hypothetical protein